MIHPKLCGNWAFPQNLYTRKLGQTTVFFALETLEDKEIEHKLKEEQTEYRQQLKKDNTENKKLETRNKNRKNDGTERKIGETKSENITRLQNVTENGEQGMCMECIDDI